MKELKKELDEKILNEAFELGLEFGDDWLNSTGKRLKSIYPKLSYSTRRSLDKHIKDMRKLSIDLVLKCLEGCKSQDAAFKILDKDTSIINGLKEASPHLNDNILGKLYSQAIYYTRK